jgi:hypothetical protein
LFEVSHPECDPDERGWGLPLAYDFTRSIPLASEEQYLAFDLPTGSISGTLRGPNGEPVAHHEVRMDSDSLRKGWSIAVSDAAGHFEFRGLPAGTHRLETGGAQPFGDRRGLPNLAFESRRLNLEGAATRIEGVDIGLVPGGELECQFTVQHGSVPSGTWAYAHPASAPVGSWFLLGQTEADGRAHATAESFITGLPYGTLDISLRGPGGTRLVTTAEACATIKGGERTKVSLRLEPGTVLVIRARGASDTPRFVRLNLVRDGEGREHFINGPENEFRPMLRTLPLPSGKYTIGVADPSGKTFTQEVVLSGSPEQEVTFSF